MDVLKHKRDSRVHPHAVVHHRRRRLLRRRAHPTPQTPRNRSRTPSASVEPRATRRRRRRRRRSPARLRSFAPPVRETQPCLTVRPRTARAAVPVGAATATTRAGIPSISQRAATAAGTPSRSRARGQRLRRRDRLVVEYTSSWIPDRCAAVSRTNEPPVPVDAVPDVVLVHRAQDHDSARV